MNEQDKILIKLIRDGDKKAFEILFKTFHYKLCNFSINFTHDKEASKDLVSNVFFKIWDKRESFNIKISLSSYLFRAVHNSSINYLERVRIIRGYQTKVEVDYRRTDSQYYQLEYLQNPECQLMEKELDYWIQRGIENLREPTKTVFYLSRFEKKTYREISVILDIAPDTVKMHISKALAALKNFLLNTFSEKKQKDGSYAS